MSPAVSERATPVVGSQSPAIGHVAFEGSLTLGTRNIRLSQTYEVVFAGESEKKNTLALLVRNKEGFQFMFWIRDKEEDDEEGNLELQPYLTFDPQLDNCDRMTHLAVTECGMLIAACFGGGKKFVVWKYDYRERQWVWERVEAVLPECDCTAFRWLPEKPSRLEFRHGQVSWYYEAYRGKRNESTWREKK